MREVNAAEALKRHICELGPRESQRTLSWLYSLPYFLCRARTTSLFTEVKIMQESVLTKTTLLVPSAMMKARALSLKCTPATKKKRTQPRCAKARHQRWHLYDEVSSGVLIGLKNS